MKALFPLDADRTTRDCVMTAGFMLAVLVVLTPPALLDPRTLDGVNVWAKPLRFALAFGLHFATLAILAQLLVPAVREGRLFARCVTVSVGFVVFEILYMAVQAARARASHFNLETPFESRMYLAMGIGAVLIVAASFVLGFLIHRESGADRPGLRIGAALGLMGGSALTLAVTGYMSTIVFSHWIGATAGDATGVPLLGWSREVGDLRPSHFVATHAMQVLPLVGWAGDRFAPARARTWVWAAAGLLAAVTLALFVQALVGRPLWPLPEVA